MRWMQPVRGKRALGMVRRASVPSAQPATESGQATACLHRDTYMHPEAIPAILTALAPLVLATAALVTAWRSRGSVAPVGETRPDVHVDGPHA
jgi:hypothetical protein